MNLAERLDYWNSWYDRLPSEWRFQVVLWPLVAVGAINMALTVAIGFPFGLLVLIGILFFAAVRAPYVLGWIVPAAELPSGAAGDPRLEIAGADWLVDLNRRYEAMPETRRFWVFPVILLVAGTINMLLTIWAGFPFGLLFLLALVALVAMRAPYTGGFLKPPPSVGSAVAVPYNPGIGLAPRPGIPMEAPPADPAMPPSAGLPTGATPSAAATDSAQRHEANDRGAAPRDELG